MGFVRGNKVKVILNAPLRDPIEYEIIGYRISLRREQAEKIEVISESEAKQMLSEGEPVTTVADSLGFSSQNYFSTAFKRKTGVSPSEYKVF